MAKYGQIEGTLLKILLQLNILGEFSDLEQKFDTQKSLSLQQNAPILKCSELWLGSLLSNLHLPKCLQLAIGDWANIILRDLKIVEAISNLYSIGNCFSIYSKFG